MTEPIVVYPVDFTRRSDALAYLEMLDSYARDPMGAGQPLPSEVRDKLIRDLAADPHAHGLIAARGGEPIGFATCFVGYSTFRATPLLNIHDIAVVPAARGRGVATALLQAITELADRLSCCKVTLEVRQDNLPAQRVYARDGFAAAPCSLFMEKLL